MKAKKPRSHNEWFQSSASTRKCTCGSGLRNTYIWGEYVATRWRRIDGFCLVCFPRRVLARLVSHTAPCGCTVQAQARSGYTIPDWIYEGVATCNPESVCTDA